MERLQCRVSSKQMSTNINIKTRKKTSWESNNKNHAKKTAPIETKRHHWHGSIACACISLWKVLNERTQWCLQTTNAPFFAYNLSFSSAGSHGLCVCCVLTMFLYRFVFSIAGVLASNVKLFQCDISFRAHWIDWAH